MNKMIFPIGVTLTINGEKIVYLDIDDEPHILVAGINGSGKTSFIKCLLTAMCLKNIEIKIIDLKMGGDYSVFKNYKHLTAFINNGNNIIEDAKEEIQNVRNIMQTRYGELNKANCKDFRDYNKTHKGSMKPIAVLIEEYILISDDKQSKKDLNIILSQARACNIKFILALQRPCHENLDSKIKANCNHTVTFRVNNTYNSGIVLSEGDARAFTELHGKGEAILLNSNQDVLFKSYYLTDREIKQRIFMKCNSEHVIPLKNVQKVTPIELKEVSLI